jgi:hypothetical protein
VSDLLAKAGAVAMEKKMATIRDIYLDRPQAVVRRF